MSYKNIIYEKFSWKKACQYALTRMKLNIVAAVFLSKLYFQENVMQQKTSMDANIITFEIFFFFFFCFQERFKETGGCLISIKCTSKDKISILNFLFVFFNPMQQCLFIPIILKCLPQEWIFFKMIMCLHNYCFSL